MMLSMLFNKVLSFKATACDTEGLARGTLLSLWFDEVFFNCMFDS